MKRPVTLINAPFNLGLRPLRSGHEPGTWRAPRALLDAGLKDALAAAEVVDLDRPAYAFREQAGTRLANGHDIRRFNLQLASAITVSMQAGTVPIVIGGDCSILLGGLAGARRLSPLSLVHVDGHSDFRHPGNFDAHNVLGAAAGMDLALATGRGEG